MPHLAKYTETLTYRVYNAGTDHEHRVLMPSELDLAIQRMMIDEQEQELERLRSQIEPTEIQKARREIETAEGAALDLAMSRIRSHEDRRLQEVEGWETAKYRSERALERMENPPDEDKAVCKVVVERYHLREFSRKDLLEADDEHSEVVSLNGLDQKQTDTVRRNLELLGGVMLGQWWPVPDVPNENDNSREKKEFTDPDGVKRTYMLVKPGEQLNPGEDPLLPEDPSEIQMKVSQTLIDRMWAKNNMSPALMGFFGKREKPSRLKPT